MSDTTNLGINHLVGVIDQDDAASRAEGELKSAGYDETFILTGESGAEQINARGENSGFFGRIMGQIESHLSEGPNYLKQYEEEARNGRYIVAVEVPDRDDAERARGILDRNGAQNIRFFGKLAVADLSVESNPSIRSDASPENQTEL
jgi:hypothetical protein